MYWELYPTDIGNYLWIKLIPPKSEAITVSLSERFHDEFLFSFTFRWTKYCITLIARTLRASLGRKWVLFTFKTRARLTGDRSFIEQVAYAMYRAYIYTWIDATLTSLWMKRVNRSVNHYTWRTREPARLTGLPGDRTCSLFEQVGWNASNNSTDHILSTFQFPIVARFFKETALSIILGYQYCIYF